MKPHLLSVKFRFFLLLGAACLCGVAPVFGQTSLAWRVEAADGNWSTANNWWNGAATQTPPGSEILRFGNAVQLTMANDLTGSSANRHKIFFDAGSGARTISGSTANSFFDFSTTQPAIQNDSGNTQTINFPVVNANANGANALDIIANSGALTFGGTISASGGSRTLYPQGAANINFNGSVQNGSGSTLAINKSSGAGTLTLGTGNGDTTANTYSGLTTVTAGQLTLNKANGTDAVAGDITVNGGTLFFNRGNQLKNTGSITLSSGTLNLSGQPETLNNLTITGGTVSSANTAVWTVTGTLKNTGAVTISLGQGGTGGSWTANAAEFAGSSVFNLRGSDSSTAASVLNIGAGGLLFSGNSTINANGNATGGGKLVLGGNVSVTGTSTAATIANTGTAGAGLSGFVDLGGATRTFDVASTATLTIGNNAANQSVYVSNGGLTKSGGTGTLVLGGGNVDNVANTYSGLTTVTAGQLTLNKAASTIGIAGNVLINGGTLQINRLNNLASTATLTMSSGVFSINGSQTINNLNISGGTFSQLGNNPDLTVSGTTAISGGATFTWAGVGIFSPGALSFTDASTLNNNSRPLTLGGNVTTTGTGTAKITSVNGLGLGATRVFDIGSGHTLQVDPGISGNTFGITKSGGTGTLVLGNGSLDNVANTYSGLTTVSAGQLTLSKANGTDAVAGDITVNGGTLLFGRANQLKDTGSITLSSGTVDFNNGNSATETFNNFTMSGGTLANLGGTVVNGTANISGGSGQSLAGGRTFSATALSLSGGVNFSVSGSSSASLTVGSGGLTMDNATITLNSGGTGGKLALNGNVSVSATALSTIAGTATATAGYVDLGAGTRTFTVNHTSGSQTSDLTVSAIIQNGSVTKAGTGTLTLSGVNTYSGSTTITAGMLALGANGYITNSASIVVASNAVFDVSARTTTFTLALALPSQILSNSAPGAIINGTNNCSAGILSLVYDGVNPCFTQTNGGMTLSAATTFNVNNTGTPLLGSYKIIAKAGGVSPGLVAGAALPSVTLGGNGKAANTGTPVLQINNGELYLVVPPTPATLGNNGPICAGNTLNLTASTVSGATYAWTGPNGFTSSAQNPSIVSATTAASGTYTNTVTVNGATSAQATTSATVNALPFAAYSSLTKNAGAEYKLALTNLTGNVAGVGISSLNLTTSGNRNLVLDGANLGSSTMVLVPAATTNGETFTYTVTNATCSANGTVTITVTGSSGQQDATIRTDGGSGIILTFYGVLNTGYTIQRADDVNFTVNVTNLATINTGSSGQIVYTNNIGLGNQAYYRLTYP